MTNMTIGNPAKLIIKFSLPLLIGNILQQMYNIVDSIVVGNFAGKEALAAVGNSFIINFLLISLFMGMGMGATILISQFFGAKNEQKVKLTIETVYIAMIIGSILVTVIGLVFSRPILKLMNTPEGQTMELSVLYLKTIFIGTIASFGFNINSSILQGIGDSKTSLLFLTIATVANIILDLVFVAIFKMGVFGAALATIIAQLIAFIYSIIYINRMNSFIHITMPHKMHFDSNLMIHITKLGLPAGFQNMLFCFGTIVLQRLVNGYGPGFMAGYSAVNKIDSFVFLPITSVSTAITTYVGQNVGANQIDRVKKGVRSSCLMSCSLCIVISALVFFFGKFLLMAFSRDTEVLTTGIEYLHRLIPFYFLLAIIFILNSAMRGAGQSMIPLVSSMISLLLARVPSAYILDHFFGKYNIFWCFLVGWIIGILITVPYYLSNRWLNKGITIREDK